MNHKLFLIVFLLWGSLVDSAVEVEVSIKVQTQSGEAVQNAVLLIEQLGITYDTDKEGSITFFIPEGEYKFLFQAIGFQSIEQEISLTSGRAKIEVDVVLHPAVMQFEEIVASADEGSSPSSIATPSNTIDLKEEGNTSSVLDAVLEVPGVAPLGQGGLFQVPSIRGAARERTLLLLESVRITSERRTGPSFSFVDPVLLDRVQINRGPAPVLYGSNGETGLIQAFTLEPQAGSSKTTARSGYESNTGINWQSISFGKGKNNLQYVFAGARRESGDYETSTGDSFPSGYNRYNFLAKVRWLTEKSIFTFLFLPSRTESIDKARVDFESRSTVYPLETHEIYAFDWQGHQITGEYDFQFQGWYHPASLLTVDSRFQDGSLSQRSEVKNSSDDYGLHFKIGKTLRNNWKVWSGVQLFGRANVNARQKSFLPDPSGIVLVEDFFSLQDASREDLGFFFTGMGELGRLTANGGVRVNRVSMENQAGSFRPFVSYNWTGFLGGKYSFSPDWDLLLNVGRGVRPANLSERFFTGQTGRGSILGNPQLATESNFEVDGGLRFQRAGASAAVYLFRNRIFDFIERVRVQRDQFTFVNQDGVTVSGIEGEAFINWRQFLLYGNFHRIDGENDAQEDVNDIPPSRLVIGLKYKSANRGRASVELVRQFEKKDPGPTEKTIRSALLLNVKAGFLLMPPIEVNFSARNLTNRFYFPTADEKAPPAAGRSLETELVIEF